VNPLLCRAGEAPAGPPNASGVLSFFFHRHPPALFVFLPPLLADGRMDMRARPLPSIDRSPSSPPPPRHRLLYGLAFSPTIRKSEIRASMLLRRFLFAALGRMLLLSPPSTLPFFFL